MQLNKKHNKGLFSLFISLLFIHPIMTQGHQLAKELFDEHGNASTTLNTLLEATDIVCDNNITSIASATQKLQTNGGWIRDPNKELFEITEIFPEKQDLLFPLFKQLKVVDAIYPPADNYDYCIIFGGWIEEVRRRVAFLLELWNKGIRFKQIVILSGNFPTQIEDGSDNIMPYLLNANNETLTFDPTWHFSGDIPKTETDIMKVVFEQSLMPDELKQIPVFYTDTLTPAGKHRPNTNDTIIDLFEHHISPGNILAISSQPYRYQGASLSTYTPESFNNFYIHTAFACVEKDTKNSQFLDAIMRWIYQEDKLQQQKVYRR